MCKPIAKPKKINECILFEESCLEEEGAKAKFPSSLKNTPATQSQSS
jgi:hypothetical protein